MRTRILPIAIVLATFLVCGFAVIASAAPAEPVNVVVLGDSTASGTGAGEYRDRTAGVCWRSGHSYSEVAAAKLRTGGRKVQVRSVACSGAAINDVRTAFKNEPAQLDALKPDTNLVLLTLGANDVSYAEFGALCIQGDCSKAGKSVTDQLPAMSKNLLKLFGEIKARSPRARIVAVAYGRQLALGHNSLTALDPVCAPILFTSEERVEGNKVASALDAALRGTVKQAKDSGIDALFVSPYKADSVTVGKEFANHAQCESGVPYYRGFDALLPTQEGKEAVLHLNRAGHAALGGLVAASVR
ncbi:SGNH/GDSL hydrolase family protein [Allokutzneria sp. A3M-2-11 16]|uniref:SGNH/GDSL hydrolase family protein n=1 Tax=Allokutzneria sp. A3M-2-11 16 TaxID=2962043 RepID=UPI0020B6E723|nr:SGNH/GDSL hydrolase family protein [Allokutzneria sp. A3M-2-11 16]MCP3799148.1 SGNH/GDSL hydrolase family protein [Allokutzneria sp. A3M-2-11 16]